MVGIAGRPVCRAHRGRPGGSWIFESKSNRKVFGLFVGGSAARVSVPVRRGSVGRTRRRRGGLCRRGTGRKVRLPVGAVMPEHGGAGSRVRCSNCVEHAGRGRELGIRCRRPRPSGAAPVAASPVRQEVGSGRRLVEWIKEGAGVVNRCQGRPDLRLKGPGRS